MLLLRDVITALANELKASPTRKAKVTLAVNIIERSAGTPPAILVLTQADAKSPLHTITLEVGAAAATPDTVSEPEHQFKALPAPASLNKRSPLISALTEIFGAPGFDNAARASVFAEIVDGLTPEQMEALLNSFETDTREVPLERPTEPAVAVARTRVTRLLKLGPLGFPGGLPALLRLCRETPAAELSKTLRQTWKTQSEWIDTTPPGVSLQP